MDYSKSLEELTSIKSVFNEIYYYLSTSGWTYKNKGQVVIIPFIVSPTTWSHSVTEGLLTGSLFNGNSKIFQINWYEIQFEMVVVEEIYVKYWQLGMSLYDLTNMQMSHLKDIHTFENNVNIHKQAWLDSERKRIMEILELIEVKKKAHAIMMEEADKLWDEIEKLEESLPENYQQIIENND